MRSHTSHIAAALLIAWVIFVISRGELPLYMGILGIGGRNINASHCGGGGGGVIPNIFPTVTAALPSLPPIFDGGGGGCDPSIDPTCGDGGDTTPV